METKTVDNRIRKEVSKGGLDVSRVYSSEYQKEGTETAELRQTVTTKSYYPTKSIANNRQDNVFGMQDFGFEEQEFVNVENRVTWIDVPKGTTAEQVKAKLAAHPEAGLYRVLANKPILTDNQEYAIKTGLASYDQFANSQVVRYPENAEGGNGGKIAPDTNGKPQYRAIFFKVDAPQDIDMRTAETEDFYASAEIKAELNNSSAHVIPGQSL